MPDEEAPFFRAFEALLASLTPEGKRAARELVPAFEHEFERLRRIRPSCDKRYALHRVAGACWVPELNTVLLGDGTEWEGLVIQLDAVTNARAKGLLKRAEEPLKLPAPILFLDGDSRDVVAMTPEVLRAFGADDKDVGLEMVFSWLCIATGQGTARSLSAIQLLACYLSVLAELFPLSAKERAMWAHNVRSSGTGPAPFPEQDDQLTVPRWLDALTGNPNLASETELFEPDYFESVNWRRDFRRNKNQHLVLASGNLYENWLGHASLPTVFRPFLCNPDYVGRAELALYLKLLLLMDQRGVCYPSYDELKDGLFKQAKQVSPVMTSLLRKHLVLRSEQKVRIPWLGKRSDYARYVYQRPMAAYTIARMHYLGFQDLTVEGGSVVNSVDVYLDAATFSQCVEGLLSAFTARGEKEEKNRKSAAGKLLSELDLPLPELSAAAIRAWLFTTFLTEDERARVKVDGRTINRLAPKTAAS